MKKQEGFSLVELLVVVIIIAIVAAIAIPNLISSRRAANQSSALADLRTIHSAEVTYLAGSGNNTKYGTLAELNTDKLIDTSWTAGTVKKNTYTFTQSVDATDAHTYCASASSDDTLAKDYGINEEGVLYEGANASQTCAAGVLADTTTVVGSN